MTKLKVAYLGPEGTYSYQSAISMYPDAQLISYRSLDIIVESLIQSDVDVGILPIENSTSSNVHEAVDLVIRNELEIVTEKFLRVKFNLIGLKDASNQTNSIKNIIAHPLAAKQCIQYLSKFDYELITASSNVHAQQLLLEENNPAYAAISTSDLISEKLLKIEEDVHDHSHNLTRFIAVSFSEPMAKDFNKVTALIKIHHEPGSLLHVLQSFADLNINLTKIESRPIPGTDWEYLFWFDFLANEESLSKYIENSRDNVSFMKVIGKYHSGN